MFYILLNKKKKKQMVKMRSVKEYMHSLFDCQRSTKGEFIPVSLRTRRKS